MRALLPHPPGLVPVSSSFYPRSDDVAQECSPVFSVLTDSLEKVFGETEPRPAELVGGFHASGFLGEVLSLQLALHLDSDSAPDTAPADRVAHARPLEDPTAAIEVQVSGSAAELVRLSTVRRVPVSSPAPENADEHYLVTEPGDYPDLLEPVTEGTVELTPGRWEALWIDVIAESEADAGEHEVTITVSDGDGAQVLAEHTAQVQIHPHRLPELTITNTHWFHADSLSTYYDVEVFSERHWELIRTHLASAREMDVRSEADAGEHEVTITVSDGDGAQVLAEHTAQVQIHPHRLPELTITNTHWFHADSLSTYYDVEVFSERHWELIRTHLASAREMDVNSVPTPTWTPPLDTAEGHTRPVVQLVGITDTGAGYTFDFSRLDRWLGICRDLGMRSLEIAHLFTQWGARFTPAIQVRTTEGVEDRFGWHVPATSPAYRRLLEALIPALREHLRSEEHPSELQSRGH